jgi:hypothetical protein
MRMDLSRTRELTLKTISSWRRRYSLQEGDSTIATFYFPLMTYTAKVEVDGLTLKIKRHGVFRHWYKIRDCENNTDIAIYNRKNGFQFFGEDTIPTKWIKLGRKEGWAFVGPDGGPLVAVKPKKSMINLSAKLKLASVLPRRQELIASALASYIIILRAADSQTTIFYTAP